MNVLIFEFRWLDEKICEFSGSVGARFGRKKLAIGADFSIEIKSEKKKCAGSFSENSWQICPQNFSGKAKCELCRAREKSFVFTAFDGFNFENVNDEDLAKIKFPHLVYFAFFDENLVKVGVCNSSRKNLRQLEQGSLATLFVAATPDGISARQIETIFRQNYFADKIKSATKKKFLSPEPAENAEKILREIFVDKKKIFSEHPNLENFFEKKPEFQNWEIFYGLPKIRDSNKNLHFVDLKFGEAVSGKIVAIRGPFIFLETDEEIAAICAKDFAGLEVDFSPRPRGISVNSALQKTLF